MAEDTKPFIQINSSTKLENMPIDNATFLMSKDGAYPPQCIARAKTKKKILLHVFYNRGFNLNLKFGENIKWNFQ